MMMMMVTEMKVLMMLKFDKTDVLFQIQKEERKIRYEESIMRLTLVQSLCGQEKQLKYKSDDVLSINRLGQASHSQYLDVLKCNLFSFSLNKLWYLCESLSVCALYQGSYSLNLHKKQKAYPDIRLRIFTCTGCRSAFTLHSPIYFRFPNDHFDSKPISSSF